MPAFDEYFPFDKGYGATANATRWRKMGQFFMPDGVASTKSPLAIGLAATLTGGQVTVQPGVALIRGYYAELQTAVTFAVGTNGMVVAGVDLVAEVVNLYYKDATTDYSGLTRTDTLWEIPLWLVSGTTLSDLRSGVTQGRGLGTLFGNLGIWYPVNPGQTTIFNVGTARFTHPCLVHTVACMQVNLNNAVYLQNMIWDVIFQSGQPDQAESWSYEGFYWPGGGGINAGWSFETLSTIVCAFWINTPGKKTFGIKVSCGTGASAIQVGNLTISVIQMGSLPNV